MTSPLSPMQNVFEKATETIKANTSMNQCRFTGPTTLIWWQSVGQTFWIITQDQQLLQFTHVDRFESQDGEHYYGILKDARGCLHTISMYDIVAYVNRPEL